MATKQVIAMRTDLNMRKGKMVAQGGHASQGWITRRVTEAIREGNLGMTVGELIKRESESEWLLNSFAKICCKSRSELELLELHQKAVDIGLEVSLIQDSGRTEFHGVPTYTCLAIGPDNAEKIDQVTGGLELL